MSKKIIYDSIYEDYCDNDKSLSIFIKDLPQLTCDDEISIHSDTLGTTIVIYRSREETDDEFNKRIEKEKIIKEKQLELAAIEKKKKYLYFKEQYESLKNEFES